jgi:hypothetical protein
MHGQSASTYPDKRKQLFEIHLMLIGRFTGDDQLSKKPEDHTREDIFRLMQGLKKSGLKIECPQWNFKIGDLRNEKIVSNAEIDNIIQRYTEIKAT